MVLVCSRGHLVVAQMPTSARTPVRTALKLSLHKRALLIACSVCVCAEIRDTLNNLILNSPQTWQTSVGLPYFQITGTVVEWDEVRFDVRLMRARSRYSNHNCAPHTRLRN